MILPTSMKSSTATTSLCTAMTLIDCSCLICSGIAENDEVVAVEDFLDVGNILGKIWVSLSRFVPVSGLLMTSLYKENGISWALNVLVLTLAHPVIHFYHRTYADTIADAIDQLLISISTLKDIVV